ncbi:uncharacterized protein DUF4974 [Dyadobacter jejuensis]|uniref:Uncharacterized protein DUF4974 n=1 Tax=Dyadobacter jejuensis TaxID=1082580 RepID=A0A316AHE9_9BACT|nr:FecR family protein [Dyadobacter jejuensis]PWJ56708.1 uncharacterized protein DUF4974 [Dyadobacter jejuensis]
MKNYENYGVESFLQDADFRDWVLGKTVDEAFWMKFAQMHPDKEAVMQEAERLIRATQVEVEELSPKEIRAEVDRFIKNATGTATSSTRFEGDGPTSVTIRPLSPLLYRIAMGVLFFVGLFWIGRHYWRPAPVAQGFVAKEAPVGMVETYNNTGKPLPIVLSDSSHIILSDGSRLSYPATFSDSARLVYLNGEASFSVSHRGDPFIVFSKEIATKVLGTRFVINAFENRRKYTVQVQSGKVSVYPVDPNNPLSAGPLAGLILTANQAAIFDKESGQLIKTLVAQPVVIQKTVLPADRIYDEVPMPTLIKELEKAYGISIAMDFERFEKCRITATLSNEPLFEQLEAICKSVSASYEIVDGQIVISGKGCH